MNRYILLLNCLDRPGIVHEITGALLDLNANILDADQHSTSDHQGRFFIRIEFVLNDASGVTNMASQLAIALSAEVQVVSLNQPLHCSVLVLRRPLFAELLYQWTSGALNIVIDSIISNHDHYQSLADWYGIPFHYVPSDSKRESETQMLSLTSATDMLIMARYMQILSAEFLREYNRSVVNIHHSFLPSFTGAKPYHQAFDRGVKLIGATAHYATAALDEGPIIVQKVAPVSHRDRVDDLKRIGQQLENNALLMPLPVFQSTGDCS